MRITVKLCGSVSEMKRPVRLIILLASCRIPVIALVRVEVT